MPHLVKKIREVVFRHLTAILRNDGVSAHFILLHLLSKVHTRVDDVDVGKLALNLIGLNKESTSVFGTRLSQTFKHLRPFTNFMPLTLEYLNTTSLAPKKDYQTNRLIPGVLQLPADSHLMVDETQLESRSLNSIEIENTKLLKKSDRVSKILQGGNGSGIQLLFFSEGKSNIVSSDVIVPFQPSFASSEIQVTEELEAWIWYLATI
ncbi:Mini-chromosome maintenance complex-binding protein [Hibiscus syriacus]|uniref:Mini-chromosome maintenance complex-binding protein n=1 Tax=Hibiscus syriacus TaxID=106335 RepID=A0A6A2WPH7_HIBSY|nr:Mini-chromosome maintenance complex-binding protein [Hibiscus syriacus]